MSLRKWYHWLLALPIAFPILLMLCEHFFGSWFINYEKDPDDSEWAAIAMPFQLSLIFGGIQYVIFCAGIIWWWRNKPLTTVTRSLYLLPLIFLPICFLGTFIAFTIPDGFKSIAPASAIAMMVSLYVIPIGYFYVALAAVMTFIFKRTGWLKS